MCMVSVIMTSYNKPEFIGKSIEGILNQSFKDFELFIMDDNSNKETIREIKRFRKDKRIRFFQSNVSNDDMRVEKIRYAVMINKALEMINGKYVTYATDDNVYRPRRLEKMVHFMEKNQKVNICYSSQKVSYLNYANIATKVLTRKAKSILWIAPCAVDHCSIMHRSNILPIINERFGSYWDEDPRYYLRGDARFFWRLNHYWPFYPIREILDDNAITQKSIHAQINKVQSPMRKLPKQVSCKELRESLRRIRSDV